MGLQLPDKTPQFKQKQQAAYKVHERRRHGVNQKMRLSKGQPKKVSLEIHFLPHLLLIKKQMRLWKTK